MHQALDLFIKLGAFSFIAWVCLMALLGAPEIIRPGLVKNRWFRYAHVFFAFVASLFQFWVGLLDLMARQYRGSVFLMIGLLLLYWSIEALHSPKTAFMYRDLNT